MKMQYNKLSSFQEGNYIVNVFTKDRFKIIKVVPKGPKQKEIFFLNTKKGTVHHNSATALSFCKNIIIKESNNETVN